MVQERVWESANPVAAELCRLSLVLFSPLPWRHSVEHDAGADPVGQEKVRNAQEQGVVSSWVHRQWEDGYGGFDRRPSHLAGSGCRGGLTARKS